MKRTALVILGTALLIFAFLQCASPAVKNAKTFLEKGEIAQAKEQLVTALETDPANPEVHFMLGKVYQAEKDYVKMNEHFEECLANSPKPAQVLDIEMERNRTFNQYFNDAARTLNASFEQTDSDKRNEMLKEAIGYLETSTKVIEKESSYEAMGTAYFNLGEYDKAKEFYKKALELDPQLRTANIQLGALYYNSAVSGEAGDFQVAQNYFEKFIELYPEDKTSVFELGYCYAKTGNVDKAIAFFEEVVAEKPDDVEGLTQYGVVLFESNEKEKAAEVFQRALALDPNNLQVLKNIAFPMFYDVFNRSQEGATIEPAEWESARPYLEKVSQLEPGNADAWEALAVLYINIGMKDEANDALAKAEAIRK